MLARVTRALAQGVRSQLHPSMLLLLLIPFFVALILWGLAGWFVWRPMVDWLSATLFESTSAMRWVGAGMARIGIDDFGGLAASVIAFLLWIPLMFATAMLVIAAVAMPWVTRHLGRHDYVDVERRGSSWDVLPSLWNALKAFSLFVVGYIVTLPLWLIPPLALIVPWLWWSWLTARLMSHDSLVEHAQVDERRGLIVRDRREFFLLGLAVCALNYIPPLFLITPVLSALVFVHYALSRLRERRGGPERIEHVIRPDHHR